MTQEDDPTAVEPDDPDATPKGQGRGQDPDKTTGQARADEVHERNAERIRQRAEQEEADATLNEPDPDQLPDKPEISEDEMPPEEGDDPPADDEEEEVPEEEFLEPEVARDDDTIDDQEVEEHPHPAQDLPEGATAADYDKEQQDGAEETPPREVDR